MIIPTPYHKVSAINPLPISLQWLYEFMHHSYSLRVVDENHYLIYFSMSYKKSNNFYRKFDRSLLTSSPVLRLLQFPFDIILQIQFWYQSYLAISIIEYRVSVKYISSYTRCYDYCTVPPPSYSLRVGDERELIWICMSQEATYFPFQTSLSEFDTDKSWVLNVEHEYIYIRELLTCSAGVFEKISISGINQILYLYFPSWNCLQNPICLVPTRWDRIGNRSCWHLK